ncbi:MAG: hypothetical protein RLY17_1089 [Pseudomonadota bacterium]|jgi:hypothetical protein
MNLEVIGESLQIINHLVINQSENEREAHKKTMTGKVEKVQSSNKRPGNNSPVKTALMGLFRVKPVVSAFPYFL